MGQLRDSCVRVLRGWYSLPVDKRYPCGGANCIQNNVSTPEHKDLARKISAQSTVLVKNTGVRESYSSFLPMSSRRRLGDRAAPAQVHQSPSPRAGCRA